MPRTAWSLWHLTVLRTLRNSLGTASKWKKNKGGDCVRVCALSLRQCGEAFCLQRLRKLFFLGHFDPVLWIFINWGADFLSSCQGSTISFFFFFIWPADKSKTKYMIALEKTNYKRKPSRAPNSGPYVKSNGPAIASAVNILHQLGMKIKHSTTNCYNL